MALADLAAYKAGLLSPRQPYWATKGSLTTVATRPYSMWRVAPYTSATPTAPTTAAALDRTSAGAFAQFDAGTSLRMLAAQFNSSQTFGGTWVLCDRLSHSGGLSGTTTGAQTTNLPTAALTRYTDGVGVMAAIEIYTAIGSTGTTFTASYTNQAGTAGQTTTATVIGGTGFNAIGRMLPFQLQQGDYGVRAVANVNLVASTGTVGDFGVTLFKPLMAFPMQASNLPFSFDSFFGLGGNMPEILAGACLFWMVLPISTSTGATMYTLQFAED